MPKEINAKDQSTLLELIHKYEQADRRTMEKLFFKAGILDDLDSWKEDGGFVRWLGTTLHSEANGLYLEVRGEMGDDFNGNPSEMSVFVRVTKGEIEASMSLPENEKTTGRIHFENLEKELNASFANVHDVLLESLGVALEKEDIPTLIQLLPDYIVGTGTSYGFNDTAVRDLLCTWSLKHKQTIREALKNRIEA